ncbi:unnamed protein product [Paramecium sonneborni]|uniref:Uncharacterized protein n=1 Tax=Paramecium sonneborni TaxID=65129 RepID=A0A8S1PZG2_9CILI|nr:unnamed protein product [Paramecium sonneborni]
MNEIKIWKAEGVQDKDLKLKKTKLTISYNQKDKQIKYIKDGEILKQEFLSHEYIDRKKILNLEQIKNLTWKSEIGLKIENLDFMIAYWKGYPLQIGGFQNEKGEKTGKWIELSDYFWDRCKVINQGQYKNGTKFGKWEILQEQKVIGGGHFDDNGIKQGEWIELHTNYYNESQIKHSGKYKDGIEIGIWETKFKNKIIGGGQYDNNGLKIGQWIELHQNFFEYCQVSYKGEYANGKKAGRWNSYDKKKLIGGGDYNMNNQKNGMWIDLHDDFWQFCQVTYQGEYLNGIKKGEWKSNYYTKSIAGGLYDDFGQKQGKWKDLHDNFHNGCQVILVGEYLNNKKFGQWNAMYMEQSDDEFRNIGGGVYDENETKIGFWNVLYEYFCDTCQIFYSGEYKNGKKNGKFDVKYKKQYENELKIIGGGTYNDNGLKDGKWIETSNVFSFYIFILLENEYQNGVRIQSQAKKQ